MERMGDIIFVTVMSFLSLWIAVRFFGCFLEKREKSFSYGVSCILYLGYQLYFHTFIGKTINPFLAFLNIPLLFLILLTGFWCRGRVKYFILTAFYGVNALLEVCISSVFKTVLHSGEAIEKGALDPAVHKLLLVIVALVFIAMIYLFSVVWDVKEKEFVPEKIFLFLPVIPVGSIVILFVQYFFRGLTLDSAIILSILILFNMVVFEMYIKFRSVYGEKAEQEGLKRQIKMYQNEFEVLKESDKRIRLIRHDLKKHMLLFETYLERGEYDEAKQYAHRISGETGSFAEYVSTGNSGVDSIVNYMAAKAEKLGVKPRVCVQVPYEPFMPDFDLNMILGNLFENALEALEKVKDGILDFYMRYDRQVLYISLYNTYDGEVKKKGKVYLTTKRGPGEHGLGLRSIEYVVEKYQGEVRIEQKDNLFQADIVLYFQGEKK